MNIHATVKAGDTDALKGMLELGTNVNARDLAGNTPPAHCCR